MNTGRDRAYAALLHKSADGRSFPSPGADLSYGFRDRDAERREAVQDGDTDLKLGHLTVEVTRHEALTQQFHTVHLCLDAAPAVIAAPSSPDGPAEAP